MAYQTKFWDTKQVRHGGARWGLNEREGMDFRVGLLARLRLFGYFFAVKKYQGNMIRKWVSSWHSCGYLKLGSRY
ncbi:MAG: hypothetical protein AB8F95_17780, partial [Bacteroidia bacterium]